MPGRALKLGSDPFRAASPRNLASRYSACAFESECAAVVAKPLPFAHNVRRARARQGIGRGELRQEALPTAEHTLHLRLLEHHLGAEHRIGVIDIPPGQIAVEPRTLAAHQSNERLRGGGVRRPRAERQLHDALDAFPWQDSVRARSMRPAQASQPPSQSPSASRTFGCSPPISKRSFNVMESQVVA